MLAYLKRNLGLLRLAIYIMTIALLFSTPVTIDFVVLKLLAVLLLLLSFYYLYKRLGFYNVNYRIPDVTCIFCLVNQIGYISWTIIPKML